MSPPPIQTHHPGIRAINQKGSNKALIFVSTLSAVAMSASATTITFDSLEQVGGGFQYLSSYHENGFNLSAGAVTFRTAR